MSAEERTADDAVYVLRSLARILRVSPNRDSHADWADQHAGYLEDIAAAVIRDASIDPKRIEAGENYVGHEWYNALIPVLFPDDLTEQISQATYGA